MDNKKFSKLEEIIEELTSDLDKEGFSKIKPDKSNKRWAGLLRWAKLPELVRYQKRNSPIDFQVGIKEDRSDKKDPDVTCIYFMVSYLFPKEINKGIGEILFPNMVHLGDCLFDYLKVNLISEAWRDVTKPENDGRVHLVYTISLEKEKTVRQYAKTVLREFIIYADKYVGANVETLERARSLSKNLGNKI